MQRQEMINNFNHTNKNMSHDEIIFHLKRSETLLIQSEKGEWLRSIYWGYIPNGENGEHTPITHNWLDKTSIICSINGVPHIGPQLINNENVIVSFAKFSETEPMWLLDSSAFITPLPTFNLWENIVQEMEKQGLTHSDLAKKSKVAPLTLQRFLEKKQLELKSDYIKKIAIALGISEAAIRGYGNDKNHLTMF